MPRWLWALDESQLQRTEDVTLAMKGGDDPPAAPRSRSSTLSAGYWELQLAVGVKSGPTYPAGSPSLGDADELTSVQRAFAIEPSLSFAITDRLTWSLPLPAFTYRFGEEGHFELLPRLGFTEAGYSSIEGFLGETDGGLALRGWSSDNQSVIGSVAAWTTFALHTQSDQPASHQRSWGVAAHVGYS